MTTRETLKVNLAVMTGGILLLLMTLPTREATFAPGELSSKHSQILNNTLVSDRCSVCHPAAHDAKHKSITGSVPDLEQTTADNTREQRDFLREWLPQTAIETAQRLTHNTGEQDQLCMQCHQSHMPLAALRMAHDLSEEKWQHLRDSHAEPAWQLVSSKSSFTESKSALQGLSSKATSCAVCHIEHNGRDFDLKLMSDARCQACHQKQFESLASGHPEFTNFPVDRPRGLMFSHARHQADHFAKRHQTFDCQNCHIDPQRGGPYGLVARSVSFEKACSGCHDTAIRAASTEGWALFQLPSLEPDSISSAPALKDWPTNARYGFDGEVSPVLRALLLADESMAPLINEIPDNGKIVDISTISDRRAVLARALAESIKSLIAETAKQGQAAWVARLEHATQAKLGRPLNDDEQRLIKRMSAGLPPDLFRIMQNEWFKGADAVAAKHGSNARLVSKSMSPPTGTAGEESTDLLLSDESDTLLSGPDESVQLSPVDAAPTMSTIKGASHLASGGWYLDQATLTLRYLPTGHADPLQAAWAQWWTLMESTDGTLVRARSALDQHASIPQADRIPGNCTQCHQLPSGSANVAAFRVPQRSRDAKEFTKFNHTPHLALPAVRDCQFCHALKPAPGRSSAATSADKFVSLQSLPPLHQTNCEFDSMKLSQCASCHRRGGAGDGCLQCHNYHINTPE